MHCFIVWVYGPCLPKKVFYSVRVVSLLVAAVINKQNQRQNWIVVFILRLKVCCVWFAKIESEGIHSLRRSKNNSLRIFFSSFLSRITSKRFFFLVCLLQKLLKVHLPCHIVVVQKPRRNLLRLFQLGMKSKQVKLLEDKECPFLVSISV